MNTPRTVVITGAAGGIGSELVDRFLANGDTVVATDVSQQALDGWRSRWDADASDDRRPSLHTVAADLASEASITALAETTRELNGSVEVLINCAAIFPLYPFEEMPVEVWRRVVDVNLTGTFLMVRAFLPLMKQSGNGRIVNIGSGTVFVGTPRQSAYVASKGGIMGLTRTLANELGGYGITVNQVTPGLTITPNAVEAMPAVVVEMQRGMRALQRDELPADVVGSVFFLASEDAAFVTGQTLNVDGGRHFL
jgi:NAD(P)-dependent dehydrogenase (short-subunit alcohol dehydrogenase family)